MLVNRIFATGRALPQIATVGKCLPFIFGIIIGASVAHAEETFQSRIQKCCKSDQIFFNGTCTVYEGDGDLNHWPFDTTVVSDYPELSVQFDIQYGSGFPKCPFGWINHTLSWNSDAVEFYILRNDYDASVIKIENNKEIKHEDFCVDRRFSGNDQEDFDGFEIKYCLLPPESLCKGAPCVRICCPQGYDKVFSPDEDACVPFPEDGSLDRWQPTLHDRQGDPIQEKAEDLEFFYGYPPETDLCARLHVHDSREDPFKIMESGDLVIGNQEYSYNEYCISPILLGLDDESRYEKIYVCHKRVDSEEEKYLNGLILTILPILLGMSCFFLFLTFILIFNRNRDKIFGVMTLCMVAMLFIFYLGLLVPYVTGSEHVEDAPGLCQFEGLAIQYTYISAMCWLNCMSYLIWKSFRKIRRTSEHDAKGWKNRQFLRYSLWGWGFPALLSMVTIVMQYLPEDSTSAVVTPEIGKIKCFLGDGAPMFYYFHIVTGPCLLFNLLGFVCTSYNLCCGIWSARPRDSVALAQHRFRMLTLVKMFFAMGISWLAEFISWLLVFYFGRKGWVIKWSFGFDIINASQGAILFLVLFFDAGTKAKIRDGCSACWDRLFRNHHVVDGSDNPVTYSGGGVLIDHYRQRQPSPRMGGGDQEGSPAPLTGGRGLEDPEGESSMQKRSPMKTLANKIAAPMRKKKTYQYNLRQDVELAETVPMKKSAKLASLK